MGDEAQATDRWLISYSYRPRSLVRASRRDAGGMNYGMKLIDVHPAVYLANAKVRLACLLASDASDRVEDYWVDEIVAVHCVIWVPAGTLNPEQAEAYD